MADMEEVDEAAINLDAPVISSPKAPEGAGIEDCPWCGSVAYFMNDLGGTFWVKCDNDHCGAAGPGCDEWTEAIPAWNRVAALRSELEALRARAAARREALDDAIAAIKAKVVAMDTVRVLPFWERHMAQECCATIRDLQIRALSAPATETEEEGKDAAGE